MAHFGFKVDCSQGIVNSQIKTKSTLHFKNTLTTDLLHCVSKDQRRQELLNKKIISRFFLTPLHEI